MSGLASPCWYALLLLLLVCLLLAPFPPELSFGVQVVSAQPPGAAGHSPRDRLAALAKQREAQKRVKAAEREEFVRRQQEEQDRIHRERQAQHDAMVHEQQQQQQLDEQSEQGRHPPLESDADIQAGHHHHQQQQQQQQQQDRSGAEQLEAAAPVEQEVLAAGDAVLDSASGAVLNGSTPADVEGDIAERRHSPLNTSEEERSDATSPEAATNAADEAPQEQQQRNETVAAEDRGEVAAERQLDLAFQHSAAAASTNDTARNEADVAVEERDAAERDEESSEQQPQRQSLQTDDEQADREADLDEVQAEAAAVDSADKPVEGRTEQQQTAQQADPPPQQEAARENDTSQHRSQLSNVQQQQQLEQQSPAVDEQVEQHSVMAPPGPASAGEETEAPTSPDKHRSEPAVGAAEERVSEKARHKEGESRQEGTTGASELEAATDSSTGGLPEQSVPPQSVSSASPWSQAQLPSAQQSQSASASLRSSFSVSSLVRSLIDRVATSAHSLTSALGRISQHTQQLHSRHAQQKLDRTDSASGRRSSHKVAPGDTEQSERQQQQQRWAEDEKQPPPFSVKRAEERARDRFHTAQQQQQRDKQNLSSAEDQQRVAQERLRDTPTTQLASADSSEGDGANSTWPAKT